MKARINDNGDITVHNADGSLASQEDIAAMIDQALKDKAAWEKMPETQKRAHLDNIRSITPIDD